MILCFWNRFIIKGFRIRRFSNIKLTRLIIVWSWKIRVVLYFFFDTSSHYFSIYLNHTWFWLLILIFTRYIYIHCWFLLEKLRSIVLLSALLTIRTLLLYHSLPNKNTLTHLFPPSFTVLITHHIFYLFETFHIFLTHLINMKLFLSHSFNLNILFNSLIFIYYLLYLINFLSELFCFLFIWFFYRSWGSMGHRPHHKWRGVWHNTQGRIWMMLL